MQPGNATDYLTSFYSSGMDQALEEIPKLSDDNFPDWKIKVVASCTLYLEECNKIYQNKHALIKILRNIGLPIGTFHKEYYLMRAFKANLEQSKNINECCSVILYRSSLNSHKNSSEQSRRIQEIFDGFNSGRVGKNIITALNADFQNNPDKRVDKQSGEIFWSGNRSSLEGSYEAYIDIGGRRTQQDRLVPPYIIERGPLKGHIFAASFDGNGSAESSVASQVAERFSKEAMSKVIDGIGSDTRLNYTFFKELGESMESANKVEWENAGATMSLLQITPEGKLHTYTLGSARTMLFQNGICKFSTIDMSTNDCKTACDIVKAMGLVSIDKKSKYKKMKDKITSDLALGNTRHKYFTDKYGMLSADRLAFIYACHYQKFNDLEKAGQYICYDGKYQYRVRGLASSSEWGNGRVFSKVQGRFSPLMQTFDLKALDADVPLQILIGSDGIVYPFNADQLVSCLKENKNDNLQCRAVKLVHATKKGTAFTNISKDNISLTLMELRMAMHDK